MAWTILRTAPGGRGTTVIEGACHCGKVRWRVDHDPPSATACNCTICRRYATLWSYGHQDVDIHVSGETRAYLWGEKSIGFHFCADCGCVCYWRSVEPGRSGRRRIAVNLRLAEPGEVADIPIEHFDGLTSWSDLPDDGRKVRDYWG